MGDANYDIEEAPVPLAAGTGMAVNDVVTQTTDQPPNAPPAAEPHMPVGGDEVDELQRQSCTIAGCQHTLIQPQFPAQCTLRARQAIWQKESSKWAKHFRQQHSNNRKTPLQTVTAQQFHNAHTTQPWHSSLVVCSACNGLVNKHNLAKHEASNRHIQAVAQQAEAVRQAALDAEMLPPGAPQPPVVVPVTATALEDTEHPDGPSYEWSLQVGTPQRAALDALTPDSVLRRQWRTIGSRQGSWVKPMAIALEYVLRGVRTSQLAVLVARNDESSEQEASATAECGAWCMLLQLLPALLLTPDGSVKRADRFMHFALGSWPSLIDGVTRFADKMAAKSRPGGSTTCKVSDTSRNIRQPGGIGRTAHAVIDGPNSSSPRTAATLAALQLKHPLGPAAEELAAAAADGTRTATTRLAALSAARVASGVTFQRMFTAESVRNTIMHTEQGVSPGLSGLRASHLQTMIKHADTEVTRRFLSHLAWLGRTTFADPDSLPDAFWRFFRAARLSAVGVKARPIACGDTLRRLFCRIYTAANAPRFSALLEPVGQFGVAVSGGVDKVGLTAQLVHEAGGTLIAIDGRNAFNSVSRTEVLRQAAQHVPEAYALIRKVYGCSAQPDLLFGLEEQALAEVLFSAEGVQQGDPMGPLLFSLVLLPIMREFQHQFPGLCMPGFLDDLTICILTGGPLLIELQALRVAYDWLVAKLAIVGIKVNTDKTVTVLPANADTRVPAEQQHRLHAFATEVLGGVKVTTEPGLTIVGSPVGTDAYVERAVAAALQDPAADRLLRTAAGMRDTQGALALLRMCYVSRATFLSRNARPEASDMPLRRFDAMVKVALAAIMQEPLAVSATGFDEFDISDDFGACLSHIRSETWVTGHHASPGCTVFTEPQQLLIHLPPRHGGFGIASQHAKRHACYVARTVVNMRSVLLTLPDTIRDQLRPVLLQLPTLLSLDRSISALHEKDELAVEGLQQLLPPELVAWAVTEHAELRELNAECVIRWAFSDPTLLVTDLPVKLQSAVCRATDAKAADRYRASIGAIEWPLGPVDGAQYMPRLKVLQAHARYNGKSSKGAAAFLTALPSVNRYLTMQAADFRESLRRWLIIEKPDPGGLCPKCDAELTAEHARRCARTGEQNARHHMMKDMIFDTLRSCTRLALVKREDAGPFIHRGWKGLFMDVTWAPGYMLLGHMGAGDKRTTPLDAESLQPGGLLDVAIIDETCPHQVRAGVAAMTGPAHKAGAATVTKVNEKFSTYGDKHPSNYTLIPFILEQSGASCEHVQLFVKAAAQHEFLSSDGAWPVSATVQRWRQKISMTLQKALSITSSRVFSHVRAVTGRPEPVANRHESVHLVLRPVGAVEEVNNLVQPEPFIIEHHLTPQLSVGDGLATGD